MYKYRLTKQSTYRVSLTEGEDGQEEELQVEQPTVQPGEDDKEGISKEEEEDVT